MPRITYKSQSGHEQVVDAAMGMSVMRAAVVNGVDGIDADCGGACACATCHVYVDPAWADRIPPATGPEADMLEFVIDRQPNSRLSCQIQVSGAIDGLVVTTPRSQH